MKYFVQGAIILSIISMSFMKPPKKIKILFFGDSITQQAIQPNGYIVKMDSIIKQSHLSDSIQLIGAGVSGNKIYDLYLRLETDVLDKNPDVVLVYIGINDIWHKRTSQTGTDADKYEKFYRAIIKKLQDKKIKVILCTPTVIGEKNDYSNEQDGDLNKYSDIIRNLSKELALPLVDLRKIFTEYLKDNNPSNQEKGILTVDRVHLNPTGNLIVANAMWKVIQSDLK
jgi:isoamyl acetate esterase